ncbi:hypothetical protein GR199_22910 [Rhizobium leguminosarum]|nr:hypothetical protein [Rhizobium leguminosarum]
MKYIGKKMFPDAWTDDDPNIAFSGRGFEQHQRVQATINLLGTAIARGDLGFALRPHDGGAFKLPRSGRDGWATFSLDDWNVDDFSQLFRSCKMYDGAHRINIGELDWIYVEQVGLKKLAAASEQSNASAIDTILSDAANAHLSPYLKLMLDLALRLKIGPDNQMKKDAIVAEVRQAWGSLPPSARLQEAMATLLREPDSQAGKAQRKK